MTCPICQSASITGIALNNGSIAHQNCFERINSQLESTKQTTNLLSRQIYDAELRLQESQQIIRVIGRFFAGGTEPALIQYQINDLRLRLEKSENELAAALRMAEPVFDLMLEYPPDWNQRVEKIKKRDRYCTSCGSNRFLQVHHITRLSKGGSNKLSNLTLLCETCHRKEHGGKQFGYTDTTSTLAISDRVETIQQAISLGVDIEFQYRKPEESAYHKRKIKPVAMKEYEHTTTDGMTLCVEGYCYTRKSNRVFALKRMKGLKKI